MTALGSAGHQVGRGMTMIKRNSAWGLGTCLVVAGVWGCGHVKHDGSNGNVAGSSGSGEAGVGAGTSGSAGSSGHPATDGGAAGAFAGGPGELGIDPGSVGMRLLTRAQYRNTVSDLLGVDTATPMTSDALPSDSGVISDLTPYFYIATQITDLAFDSPVLPELLRCEATVTGHACAVAVIDAFGTRAFRRPLLPEQKAAFGKLYDNVIASGQSHTVALKQVVRGLLTSLQFVFRVEPTDGSNGNEPYALDSYSMAARLSYLLWNTTPNAALATAAANDALRTEAGVKEQFDQLANDTRAKALTSNLGAAWLGLDSLPKTTENERPGVDAYLASFFANSTPFNQVLTLGSKPNDPMRSGLLGLPGVISAMSYPDRVSISRRGEYIATRLLCQAPLLSPPGSVTTTQKERHPLEAATQATTCRACHAQIDPWGYPLDHFNYDGAYRELYESYNTIDTTSTLPSGVVVTDEISLSAALTAQPELAACLARQLAADPLGRALNDQDASYLADLSEQFGDGAGLRDLYQHIALSVPFRYRRGSPQ